VGLQYRRKSRLEQEVGKLLEVKEQRRPRF
jgi:hypothetical protein